MSTGIDYWQFKHYVNANMFMLVKHDGEIEYYSPLPNLPPPYSHLVAYCVIAVSHRHQQILACPVDPRRPNEPYIYARIDKGLLRYAYEIPQRTSEINGVSHELFDLMHMGVGDPDILSVMEEKTAYIIQHNHSHVSLPKTPEIKQAFKDFEIQSPDQHMETVIDIFLQHEGFDSQEDFMESRGIKMKNGIVTDCFDELLKIAEWNILPHIALPKSRLFPPELETVDVYGKPVPVLMLAHLQRYGVIQFALVGPAELNILILKQGDIQYCLSPFMDNQEIKVPEYAAMLRNHALFIQETT